MILKKKKKPNILLISIDSLRADHLSLYGYQRETSPNLIKFAQKATVYHNHHSAANFTTPSTASLLTGAYPWSHRAFHFSGMISGKFEQNNLYNRLNPDYLRTGFAHNLLANALLYQIDEHIDRHVKIGSFSQLDTTIYDNLFPNDPLAAYRSFDQYLFWGDLPGSLYLSRAYTLNNIIGIKTTKEEYSSLYPRGLPYAGNPQMAFTLEGLFDGVKQIIDSQQPPFFAYLHLYPPHQPYRPRKEFFRIFRDDWNPEPKPTHFLNKEDDEARLNILRARYDEYIAHTDAELGRLFSHLEKTGVFDNSYVIVTSDHGELFERGVHGHNTPLLFEPVIHIPLIISSPKQETRVDIHSPTSNLDLFPTIMHITNQSLPEWCEGEILPGFGQTTQSQRLIYSVEAKTNPAFKALTKTTVALFQDGYKLIHYRGYEGYDQVSELYDLENDPDEINNLVKAMPALAGELQALLNEKLQQVNQPYQ